MVHSNLLSDAPASRLIKPFRFRASGRSSARASTLAFFLLFTLACGDVLSLPLAGGNFRLFYLAGLLAVAPRLLEIRLDPAFAMRILCLFALLAPNLLVSIEPKRSLLYLVWIALTLICTFGVFPRLIRFDLRRVPWAGSVKLYDALLYAFRFQIIVGLIMFGLGLHERTRFLYYEPSYFSIALAIYCALVAHRIRERKHVTSDIVLLLAYLITSASGAFVLVLLLTAALNVRRAGLKYLLLGLVSVAIMGTAYVALVDDTNTALVRLFLSGELDFYAFLLRGGNRLARLEAGWDVFLDHPLFGIGLGSFETATLSLDLDPIGTTDYLAAEGKPAINVYLELAATAGIVGFIGFAVLLWPLFRWLLGEGFRSPLSRGVICMLLILTWESNFLRPYLWVMLSLCWVEMRQARSNRNKRALPKC
ncbi:MAG: O-antigen ligase family protein [Burkholderiales bacterium]